MKIILKFHLSFCSVSLLGKSSFTSQPPRRTVCKVMCKDTLLLVFLLLITFIIWKLGRMFPSPSQIKASWLKWIGQRYSIPSQSSNKIRFNCCFTTQNSKMQQYYCRVPLKKSLLQFSLYNYIEGNKETTAICVILSIVACRVYEQIKVAHFHQIHFNVLILTSFLHSSRAQCPKSS